MRRKKLALTMSFVLVCAILPIALWGSAAAATIVHRINAGGPKISTLPEWSPDNATKPSPYVNAAATGNQTSVTSKTIDMTHPSLPAGTPELMFRSGRWDPPGDPELQWDLPVAAGDYEVRLYFAEAYGGTQSIGARVFDASIEGQVVLDNYDIFADVGGWKGVMKSFAVTSDSNLDIDLGHVTENPTIRGIEVLTADAAANELSVSPTSLTFGQVDIGSNKELQVTLTNPGAVGDPAIIVDATSITGTDATHFGDDFTDANDVTLAPGGSTVVNVKFSPTTKDGKAASLNVTHSGSNSPSAVSLSGSGTEVFPGAWHSLPGSAIDRQEASFAQVNGKFYLVGGLETGATAMEVYDPVAKTWNLVKNDLGDTVHLPKTIDHIESVVIEDKIYYLGGLSQWPGPESTNVYIFNTKTKTFTEGAAMPTTRARGAGGTALHDGKIYYAGGLHGGQAVNMFDVYDPVADTWSALPAMPTARDHFHATVMNGKFYAIGGRQRGINAFANVNEAYDFSTGQWTGGLAPLPTARGGFGTAALGDEIVVIGGEGGNKTFNTVEAYKPATNTWRTLTPMPTARHGIQVASCNNGLYVASGGKTQGGGNASTENEAFFLNGATSCLPPVEQSSLGVSPANVDFGSAPVDSTKKETIQLTNLGSTGDPNIVVDATTIEGANPGQFKDNFDDAGNVTLAPGESTSVDVTFGPTGKGTKEATLKVAHNGANAPLNIPLSGVGTIDSVAGIIYRINSGGNAVSDTPFGWSKDTAAAPSPNVNSGSSTFITTQAIDMSHGSLPAGTPQGLFKDERYDPSGGNEMEWDLPVTPGDYEVRLFFAELFYTSSGKRTFDVSIEGFTALNDMDPFAEAGGTKKGFMKSFMVASDDNLDINFLRNVENPTVAAIEVRRLDSQVVAEDLFARTATGSLGNADVGGAWSVLAGSASNFSVDGSAGKVVTPANSQQQLAHLAGTSVRDVDYRANLTFSNKPTNSAHRHFAYLTMRRQSGGEYYRIGLVLEPSGKISIRGQTGAGVNLFDDVATSLTYAPGDELRMRVMAVGANPTTLRAKVWQVGTGEPAEWNVVTSDATTALQAPGSIGVRSVTNATTATTVGIDDLRAISREGFLNLTDAPPAPVVTPIGFGKGTLTGHSSIMPTTLQFGPDGRLYVAQFDGTINIYTIARSGPNAYAVTGTETINSVKNIPNHDDNGKLSTVPEAQNTRIVTGLLTTGTAANPVMYVTSSDPRIGGHGMGGDLGLDTNSSMLSRLTWNGSSWTKLDLVRGLPRSEENHSANGLELDEATNTLFIAQGGNTNQGGVSNNFAVLPEYALSAAILSVDLDAIGNTTYDIPTLDDQSRTGTKDESDSSGGNAGDPFGGNDGKNQAKVVTGGPVQVYAPGFRNPYDLIITKAGKMYTIDNGGNAGWGAPPINEGPAGNCLNDLSEPGLSDPDALHLVTKNYYGGHPNPTRGNTFNKFNNLNWQSPVPAANPIECDYRKPGGTESTALTTFPSSTNGIDEYTASNFGGAMKGDLLGAGYVHNIIYRVQLGENGTKAVTNSSLFSTVGGNPLDVVAQGDNGPFPGTIWVADLLGTNFSGEIFVFEPNDFGGSVPVVTCSGADDPTKDEDGDGYKNDDEIDAGTDPCSSADVPHDWDKDNKSDLNDPDDDNDGMLDTTDPFAIDANNGTTTKLPINYTWDNGSPDPGGLLKMGFTGTMTNGTTNYANLFDPEKMTAGGAAGVLTVDEATNGTALIHHNSQEYGLQFGVDAKPTNTGPFTVHSRIMSPFAGVTPKDHQAMGIFIGNGDQDNYAKLEVTANGGSGGIRYVKEVAGSAVERPQAAVTLPGPNFIDLYLTVDPSAGTIQPKYSVTTGGTTGAIKKLGELGQLPTGWFTNTSKGLAIGIISTSRGSATTFPATWDFIKVTADPPATSTSGAFIESGGKVVMEVESAPPAGSWVPETEYAGYTGTSYYTWRGSNLFQLSQAGQGLLSYPVKINTGGTYTVSIRSRRDTEGRTGLETGSENDAWIRVDNGAWNKIFQPGPTVWDTWTYSNKFGWVDPDGTEQTGPATFTLAPGVHTLQLSGRSAKYKIDRIHLHTGTNPLHTTPESLREGTTTPIFDSTEKPVGDPDAPPAPTVPTNAVVADTFTRTATDKWGTADKGGTWTIVTGTDANFDVDGSKGVVVTPGGGTEHFAHVSETSTLDTEYQAKVTFPSPPSAGEHSAFLTLRRQSSGHAHFRVGAVVTSTGELLLRGRLNTGSALFPNVGVGQMSGGGTALLRVQVEGKNPTTIRAKLWKSGTTEPSAWTVQTTNTTAALQAAGTNGIRTHNSSTAATTLKFDDIVITQLGTSDGGETTALGSSDGDEGTTTTSTEVTTTDTTTTDTTTTDTTTTDAAASDTFTRTVADAWGTAVEGGTWTVIGGSTANFDVNGAQGLIVVPIGSKEQLVHLPDVSLGDVDYRAKVTFAGPPTGSGAHFAYLVLRRQSTGPYYRVGLYVDSSGKLFIRGQSSGHVGLFPDFATGLSVTAGSTFNVHVQAEGSNPTAIRAAVWKEGAAEPAMWDVQVNNDIAEVQGPGSVGVRAINTNGSATTFKIDDIQVGPITTP